MQLCPYQKSPISFSSEFKPDNRTEFFKFFTCLKTFTSIFNTKEYKATELMVINTQLCEYTKNHRAVYAKRVNFVERELYPNKPTIKKTIEDAQ